MSLDDELASLGGYLEAEPLMIAVVEKARAELAELMALKIAYQETPKQWSTAMAPTLESIVATARQISTAEENARLREQNERLREALNPFADARLLPGSPPDGWLTGWLDEHDGMLRVSDCLRAAEVLGK